MAQEPSIRYKTINFRHLFSKDSNRIYECGECGALINNVPDHQRWHDKINAQIERKEE